MELLLDLSNYIYIYEPQSVKTSLNDERRSCQNLVNYTHLINELLRSCPANLMMLSPLFRKI